MSSKTPTARPTLELFLVVVVVALVVAAAPAAAGAGSTRASPHVTENLRCLRPFSSVEKFTDVAKTPRELNCDFHFFTATKAAVSLLCDGTSGDETTRVLESCNVTLDVDLSIPEDVLERLTKRMGTIDANTVSGASRRTRAGFLTDQDDFWRYTFQLASLDDGSAVTYKGFSGDGYSLCCDGMTSGEGNCPWMSQDAGDNDLAEEDADGVEADSPQQRRLMMCPMPVPSLRRGRGQEPAVHYQRSLGPDFHVRLRKPLPSVTPGRWEARLDLSRKRVEGEREELGRVIVRFDVQPDALWAGGHVAEPTAGVREGHAVGEVDVVVVKSTSQEGATRESDKPADAEDDAAADL